MAIGLVELQGSVQRLQDYAQIKHNDDNKGLVMQSQLTKDAQKTAEDKAYTVRRGDDVNNSGKRFDAKDKGGNEYTGDGGRNRKNSNQTQDGKVVIKGTGSTLDIRI